MSVYSLNGSKLGDVTFENDSNIFSSNMHIDYKFDASGNANYTVIRIFKNRLDGSVQYPFVFCPNKMNAATQSTLSMNKQKGFPIAINAGILDTSTLKPLGVVVENGVAVRNSELGYTALTIDQNGDLGITNETDAATIINNGIVSALVGVGNNPIINNYEIPNGIFLNDNAQRQIIGQFGNGDYAIITCEGRNFDHSDGWTIAEAQRVCQEFGLKFAYNLDGGGSTETVIYKKQLNTIYEGSYGRIIGTYIVFNGTNEFKESM